MYIVYGGPIMKLLDKIALNRLLAIISSFILNLIKLFKPQDTDIIDKPKRKRPLKDLLKKVFHNE